MKIIAGNSNLPLAEEVSAYLEVPLADSTVRRFADNEVFVEILENMRGEDVFVVQSTSAPANDHLMELLIIIDALRRASARRITAVLPYFGYARQDRKPGPRTPISAKLVANLIEAAGADRVLTLDLHAGQIQGFFDIPTDNLFAAPVFVDDIKARFNGQDLMVVSPDVGGVVRTRALGNRIGADLAIVDKRRERAGESEVMNIIGDVTDRPCLLVDDIVDSGGTLCNAAEALLANGQHERARVLADRAIQSLPQSAWAWHAHAQCLQAAGEADAAVEDLRKAVRLDPHNPTVRRSLSDLLEEIGDFEGALRLVGPLIRTFPDDEELAKHYTELQQAALDAGRVRRPGTGYRSTTKPQGQP